MIGPGEYRGRPRQPGELRPRMMFRRHTRRVAMSFAYSEMIADTHNPPSGWFRRVFSHHRRSVSANVRETVCARGVVSHAL